MGDSDMAAYGDEVVTRVMQALKAPQWRRDGLADHRRSEQAKARTSVEGHRAAVALRSFPAKLKAIAAEHEETMANLARNRDLSEQGREKAHQLAREELGTALEGLARYMVSESQLLTETFNSKECVFPLAKLGAEEHQRVTALLTALPLSLPQRAMDLLSVMIEKRDFPALSYSLPVFENASEHDPRYRAHLSRLTGLMEEAKLALGNENIDAAQYARSLAGELQASASYGLSTVAREGRWDRANDAAGALAAFDSPGAGE